MNLNFTFFSFELSHFYQLLVEIKEWKQKMVDGKRGSVSSKGLFGIFSYFAQIDIDGSGFLELNEIEGSWVDW